MNAKEIAKKTGASAVGAGTSVGAVALAGIQGLSGPGIMTALATLGLGSAAIGIASVAGIGSGVAFGAKKLLDVIFE